MKQHNTSVYIGLGSNIGDRLQNLESALKEMARAGFQILKVSPVYETPALLPPSVLEEAWNKDFLNAVCEISSSISKPRDFKPDRQESQLSPETLLKILKSIEKTLGRTKSLQWAPRIIDLDILLFKDQVINKADLTIPHPALTQRNFVLAPLKDLNPLLQIPDLTEDKETVLSLFRKLNRSGLKVSVPQLDRENQKPPKEHSASPSGRGLPPTRRLDPQPLLTPSSIAMPLPAFMQIINLTPDSFSDGGQVNLKNFKALLKQTNKKPLAFLDLGAESTRPGAQALSPQEEWQRLKLYIEFFKNFYEGSSLRPRLSIDTRHVQTAEKALAQGADLINDVSGLSQDMLKFLQNTATDYVLTHSLTVPASRAHTLPLNKDPVEIIKTWLKEKINLLEQHNISLDRVIFDPGIGFGKTAGQSLEILKRIREFHIFPLRIMVGHSRKSFMQGFSSTTAEQRDLESIGLSLKLALMGVDILRVHNADLHARALRGFML